MVRLSFPIRALILAAYILAAILPALLITEGRQQSQAEHGQMMAMAGHLAHMSSTTSSLEKTQLLLCQQHCLFAAAAFPVPVPATGTIGRPVETYVRNDLLATSLATPPPGHPPKFVRI